MPRRQDSFGYGVTIPATTARVVDTAVERFGDPDPDELAFLHSILAQTLLPYRDPKTRDYVRESGRTVTIALCLLATPALADVAGTATVIDGDTLEIQGQRIRLHGIDAPESRQLCRLAGKPWMCGKDAAIALAEKIGRRPLACEERDRDRYGRIVAKCSVASEDLGEWMVANGWAVAYYLFSYEYSRAEHRAKSARRGIWASEFVMPWEWRRGKRLDTGD